MRGPHDVPGRGSSFECLAGGGEMGALMRAMDWGATPLGEVATWPQSLRTSISICLGTSFPMIVCWGPGLVMLYNDGYRPVLGKKHPRSLGQPLLECFAEIRDLIEPMFRGVITTGRAVGAEDMMFPIERSGYTEETYFIFSYSPIRDERGDVGGVLTTCTETTQRVIGERRLRSLHDLADRATRAHSAEEAFADAASIFHPAEFPFALLYLVEDRGRRARLVATSGVERGPATPESIDLTEDRGLTWPLKRAAEIGEGVVIDVGPHFGRLPGGPWPAPATQAVLLRIARPGLAHPYGFLVAGVSPRRALDDAYRGYFALVADQLAAAVANARTREEERRRIEALAALDRTKTEFFSNVSHEFRTPITLILGPLDDFIAGGRGPGAEDLKSMHRNALRLLKLVNTLLDFSRIEAGRVQGIFHPVDLAQVTVDLAGMFRAAADRAGLRFTVDCPPLPEPIWIDPELWEKIVLNLLSNALKFTFTGEIAVILRWMDGAARLEVRDTGIGIAADQVPHLFERFYRVQGAPGRTREGSGIGLALAHDLVRLHGGNITVDSEPGRGSSFLVTIRAGTAHLPKRQLGGKRTQVSTAIRAGAYVEEALRWLPGEATEPRGAHDHPDDRETPAGARATEGARILVADDNADMRDYLAGILGRHWRIDLVNDGAAALAAALADPPEAVVTDVMMPGLDGFELLRALRGDERTREIPVLMLSARAGEEARLGGLLSGADEYLTKPFSARELVARLASQLAIARARRAIEAQRDGLARALRDNEIVGGILGHDLRNPLAAIITSSMQLARNDDPKVARVAARLVSASTRMSRLIDQLLDFSRIRVGGGMTIERGPMDLAALVRQTIQEVTDAHPASQIDVDVTGDTTGRWDEDRLAQAVSNLASNAVKHGTPGAPVLVRVDGSDRSAVALTFDNQGAIREDLLAVLFDPFRGTDRGGNRTRGLGLGLFITREIVVAHGGRVTVTASGGKVRFTVTLPRA